ncbi:MAG: YtxH domain-containing protein [Chloroflexi bacterium]|nr:YtxH domain-containing protein [Chloroflexota bacterium]
MYQNNTTGLLIMGLLVGAAVGVAAGFLLAPQAGNKTREILRQGIVTGADRIRELRRGIETETQEAQTEETKAD